MKAVCGFFSPVKNAENKNGSSSTPCDTPKRINQKTRKNNLEKVYTQRTSLMNHAKFTSSQFLLSSFVCGGIHHDPTHKLVSFFFFSALVDHLLCDVIHVYKLSPKEKKKYARGLYIIIILPRWAPPQTHTSKRELHK